MLDPKDFCLSSYEYEINDDRIAQVPMEPRHSARLMIVQKAVNETKKFCHKQVWNLQDYVNPGDLIVINDTRVVKARLRIRLIGGGLGELLLLEPIKSGRWLCLVRPGKRIRPGDSLFIELNGLKPIPLQIIEKDSLTGGRIVQFPKQFFDFESINPLLDKYGEVPLPPYIDSHKQTDESRYQTCYASRLGAVAAPTAGLHLSDQLLKALSAKGVILSKVTLHVGLGTFRPLDQEDLTELQLHKEWVEVNEKVIQAIRDCRLRKGHVIAIGTTTVRALEGAFNAGNGTLKPLKGKIDLVIKPGHKFGVVDGLMTNFHLPKSSLLLLVSSLIGRKRLLKLYEEAIKSEYRFFSYGDAMLITPDSVIPEVRPQVFEGS